MVESELRSATTWVWVLLQPNSMIEGWVMSSPIVETRPLPPLTTSPQRTWLLLRMYWVVHLCTSEPSVPPQQKPLAISTGPPEVLSWVGGVCFAVWHVPPWPFMGPILPLPCPSTRSPSHIQ